MKQRSRPPPTPRSPSSGRPKTACCRKTCQSPPTQGLGVGSQLLGLAREQAQARGLPEVPLCNNEAMTENLDYYPAAVTLIPTATPQDSYRRVFFTNPVAGSSSQQAAG